MKCDSRYIRSLQREAKAQDEDRQARRKAIREGGDADAVDVLALLAGTHPVLAEFGGAA